MTNPTREQILAAHYATEQLALLATSITERQDVKDYKEMIFKALPPKPRPTMAEVEWDDDEHYLAEAETPDLVGKVVMLRKTESDLIEFIMSPYTKLTKGCTWPEKLTPTGRRYTLTEVQE